MGYLAHTEGFMHMMAGAARVSIVGIELVGERTIVNGDILTPCKVTFRSGEVARPFAAFVAWSDVEYEWRSDDARMEPHFPVELQGEAMAILDRYDRHFERVAGFEDDGDQA